MEYQLNLLDLPDELIYEQCQAMDDRELGLFVQTNSRIRDICQEILNRRKETQEERDLEYLLSVPVGRRTAKYYRVQQRFEDKYDRLLLLFESDAISRRELINWLRGQQDTNLLEFLAENDISPGSIFHTYATQVLGHDETPLYHSFLKIIEQLDLENIDAQTLKDFKTLIRYQLL